jgi:hypothetical protein
MSAAAPRLESKVIVVRLVAWLEYGSFGNVGNGF